MKTDLSKSFSSFAAIVRIEKLLTRSHTQAALNSGLWYLRYNLIWFHWIPHEFNSKKNKKHVPKLIWSETTEFPKF